MAWLPALEAILKCLHPDDLIHKNAWNSQPQPLHIDSPKKISTNSRDVITHIFVVVNTAPKWLATLENHWLFMAPYLHEITPWCTGIQVGASGHVRTGGFVKITISPIRNGNNSWPVFHVLISCDFNILISIHFLSLVEMWSMCNLCIYGLLRYLSQPKDPSSFQTLMSGRRTNRSSRRQQEVVRRPPSLHG